MNRNPIPNVIVFGSTGVGKSSVVNMLKGSSKAPVSSTARGVTFSNTHYQKTINGFPFNIYDTAGLNEGTAGTISPREGIEGLYNLTRQLTDGINLLVFVMRGRITAITKQNYHMFFDIICDRRVPIVIVVTGLENEQNMDDWWPANKHAFENNEMVFNGCACITATEGVFRSFHSAYEKSRTKVEQLIFGSFRQIPWKVSRQSWFTAAVARSHSLWPDAIRSRALIAPELKAALDSYGEVVGRDIVAEVGKSRSSRERFGVENTIPNVIVFGGDCIQDIIDMLDSLGQFPDEPQMSRTDTHEKTINGSAFRIHRTSTAKTITQEELEKQYRHIHQFKDGVNLLMFVVDAERVPLVHYGKTFETLLHKQVPVVLVVVGLSFGRDWDAWWYSQKRLFDQHEMIFYGHICITTTDRNAGQAYKDSKRQVEQLVRDSYSRVPWKASLNLGFGAMIRSYSAWSRITGLKSHILAPELCGALMLYCRLSEKEAVIVSNRIARNV